MGKLSRTKGANFERKVARALNKIQLWGADFARVTDETRDGNVGDVRDKAGAWPLVIQCKHRKAINVRDAVKEAEVAARARSVGKYEAFPLAWCRWDGGEEIVAMRAKHFVQLICAVDDHAIHGTLDPLTYPWYISLDEQEVPQP